MNECTTGDIALTLWGCFMFIGLCFLIHQMGVSEGKRIRKDDK